MYSSPRIWLLYAVVLAVAIPWYWQYLPVRVDAMIFGMPPWVFASVIGSAALSLITGCLLAKPWPDEDSEEAG